MRCSRVEHLLPAYLDGDLSSRLSQRVADHLDSCEGCRQAQAAQQSALRFLDTGRYVPAIDLWADFSRRIQQEARPRPSPWRSLWQPGLAGTFAAAVVSLVVFTAPPRQSAARWQPAPSRSMQVAQSPDLTALSVAPRSLRPKPARLLAAEEVVVHPVVVAASEKPEAARPRSSRLRQPVSPRASVTRVRKGSPPPPQSTPPVQRREQGDRRPWRIASLPLSSGVTDGVRPAASAAADAPTSGPVNVAEALMSVQQDAASSQMQDELLLMAQEVARVSGELPSTPISAESAGT